MMSYEIYWTEIAKNELSEILHFYLELENYQIAKNILTKITNSVSLLESQPFIGKKEKINEKEYRFLMSNAYKIYYEIIDYKIYILKIFDIRRNPLELKNL